MRVQLEATVGELQDKGDDLVLALARQLAPFNSGLGEALIKASRVRSSSGGVTADNLQYPVLRQIKAITTIEYERQLSGMLKDIDAVLNGTVSLRKAFGDPPEKDEDKDAEEPEEPLEPGDYNPKTDEVTPEPEEEDEEEDEEEG